MNTTTMLPARRLIPKWRTMAATLNEPEAGSHKASTAPKHLGDKQDLDRAIALWRENRTPGYLGDVLSHSVSEDLLPQVLEIGAEARRRNDSMTPVQASFINDLVLSDGESILPAVPSINSSQSAHPYQVQIRNLRALLRSSPVNPLAWLDMAQFQAAQGKLVVAERSIVTALSLAPNNRTVIRTAARFLVHADKHDMAHQLVRRHQRTPNDPWLMASEVALADLANTPSTFLSKGKRFLVENSSFNVAHLTELSGVIAGEEFKAGQLKRARDAQRKALLAPNDNMIAQAIEYRSSFGIALEGPKIQYALEHSNEAQVLKAWVECAPDLAERYAKAWHVEEPFSSRPIHFLSSLLLFKGEYEQSEEWVRVGLLTDPNDRGLLINQAFLHAYAGRGQKMQAVMRRLRSQHNDVSPFVDATNGLYEYSQKRFEAGDSLYEGAIALFMKEHRPGLAAYCRLFQALYADEFNHPNAEKVVQQARQLLAGNGTVDSSMLLYIRSHPELQMQDGQSEEHLRRTRQVMFDPKNNTLTIKEGLTARGAKELIVKGIDY